MAAERRTGTVRFRVTGLATALVAAVLVVTAVGLVAAQRRLLTDSLDDALEQRADDLGGLLASGALAEALAGGDDDIAVQLVGPGGEVVTASPALAAAPPLAAPPADQFQRTVTVEDVAGAGGSHRLLSRHVDAPDGPAVLHVAGNLEDVGDAVRVLGASLLVAIPAVVALLAALIWWLVGRTLLPVDAIQREVAGITGADLHRRVPEPGGDDEIARLARTMNTMLERVERAGARQRRFVADASHELRSPLTRIRSELEVDLAHPETASPDETHHSVLAETVAMQRLVDDLLHIARSDDGATPRRAELVDLDDLVLREADRLREDARVKVDVSRVSAAQVTGDPDQLRRVIRNLADNAERHASGRVTFRLEERAGHAHLTVADDGPGIPAQERERIFERFARLEDARTRASGGAGLGLAIVRDLVARHGGTVTAEATTAPGAHLLVRLPLNGAVCRSRSGTVGGRPSRREGGGGRLA